VHEKPLHNSKESSVACKTLVAFIIVYYYHYYFRTARNPSLSSLVIAFAAGTTVSHCHDVSLQLVYDPCMSHRFELPTVSFQGV
jgi:hypothetical protein